ncbi:MAG: hypothetical protein IT305_10825 [Chloroflexi bacterium]|nr:hypothetical protein [Chloroflexota bacterium]
MRRSAYRLAGLGDGLAAGLAAAPAAGLAPGDGLGEGDGLGFGGTVGATGVGKGVLAGGTVAAQALATMRPLAATTVRIARRIETNRRGAGPGAIDDDIRVHSS